MLFRSGQYGHCLAPSPGTSDADFRAIFRRARQWYHYGMAARASHWDTLVRVRPYVLNGQIPDEVLDTIELTLPDIMALPAVGGVVPRHGPFIPPRGERGLYESPYGPQQSWDRRFYTPSVPLPWGIGRAHV